MKVGQLHRVMELLLPILEHYREWTVEAMLKDIAEHCQTEGAVLTGEILPPDEAQPIAQATPVSGPLTGQAKEEGKSVEQAKLADRPQLPYRPSQAELLEILPELSSEELITVINGYTKEQLLALARGTGMKGYSKLNKEPLKMAICSFLTATGEAGQAINQSVLRRDKTAANPEAQAQGRPPQAVPDVISPELKAAAKALPELSPEERIQLLKSFTKKQIEMIAHYHQLRIPKNNSKDNAIRILANQVGFLNVHRNMGKRP